MRFAEQLIDIPVGNIDECTHNTITKTRRHSDLLPNNFRCIIAGDALFYKEIQLFNAIPIEI